MEPANQYGSQYEDPDAEDYAGTAAAASGRSRRSGRAPQTAAGPRQARIGVIVLTAVILELGLIGGLANEWATRRIVRRADGRALWERLVDYSWLTYTWRYQPISGQTSLFSLFGGEQQESFKAPRPVLPTVPPLSQDESLQMEKELLGVYVSGHPLQQFGDKLTFYSTHELANAEDIPDGTTVVVGGLLSATRKAMTKKGLPMMSGQVEDLTGSLEVVFFPEAYEKHWQYLTDDAKLLIRGKLSDVVSPEGVQHFLQTVPNAEFVELSGAGHTAAGDDNDAFSDVVVSFATR